MLYRSYIAYVPDRGEHVAIIVNRLTNTQVTIGCFHYRAEAERWTKDCIARKAWRNASELPDLYS